jgi:general secretion pathway protein C
MASSSHAVAALVSSVQLNGVRMSTDPMRDGAMFTLGDGAQRAFLVGQEVADGVTLADVEASYVVLSYAGGERRLDMQAGPQFSFARAMMGLERAEGAPGIAAAPAAAAVYVQAASRLSGADRAWLAATLANVETSNGVARGWRITDTAPSAVREAGLQSGDLVTAINGAGPGDLSAVLAAARGDRLDVRVERGAAQLTFSLEIEERT